MASRLVFGAGRIHRLALRSQRRRVVHAALDAGFRVFDVAPSYGDGLNELELGATLPRDGSIRIITKFGIPFDDYGARHPTLFPLFRIARKLRRSGAVRDFTPAHMMASVHASLARLRIERIDRLMIHEPVTPLPSAVVDDLAACGDQLRNAGKIGELGIAGPARSIGRVGSHGRIRVIQTLLAAADEFASLGKPMITYGVYRAYLSRGQTTGFGPFVRHTLAARANVQLILSSLSPTTVASFGHITHG